MKEANIGDIILFDSNKKLPAGCMRAHLVASDKSAFRKFIKDLEEDIKSELKNSEKKEYLETQGKYVETIKSMKKYVEHANKNPDLYSNAKQSSHALFSSIVESTKEAEQHNTIDFRKKFKNSSKISFPQVTMVSTTVAENGVNIFMKTLSQFNRETIPNLPEKKRNDLGTLKNLYEKYPEPNSLSPEELIQIYADVSIYNYNNEIYKKIKGDKNIPEDVKKANLEFHSARTTQKLLLTQHCFTEEGMANLPEGEIKSQILSIIRERDAIVQGVQNFTQEAIRLEDEYFDRMKADLRKFVEEKNKKKLEEINALGKEPTYRKSVTVENINTVFNYGIAGLEEQFFYPEQSVETPTLEGSLNNSNTSGKLLTIEDEALEAEANERNVMKGIIEIAMPNVKVEIKDEYYILHFEGKEQKVHAYKISEFNKIFEEKEEKDKIEDPIVSTINELDEMQSCMELKQLGESTKKQIVSKLIVIPEYAEIFEPKVYIVPGSENKLIALEHITEPTEILSESELSERLSKNGLEINIEKQLERKLEKLMVVEEEPGITEQTYAISLHNHTLVLEETPIIEHVMFIHQEPEQIMLCQAENNLNRTELTTMSENTTQARFMVNNSSKRDYKAFYQTFNGLKSNNKNKEVKFNPIAQTIIFDKNENEDLEFKPMYKYFSPKVVENFREAREKDKSFKNKVKSIYSFIKHKRYEVLTDLLKNDIIPEDLEVIEDKWFANKKKVLEENPKISKKDFEREEIDYKDELIYNRRKELAECVEANRITQDPEKVSEVSYLYKKCYELSISDAEKSMRKGVKLEELEERQAAWEATMAPIYAGKALLAEQRAKKEAEKGYRVSTFGALLEVGSTLTGYVADEAAKRKAAEPYYSGIPESHGSTNTPPPYQSPMYLNINNTSSTVKSTSTIGSTCNTNITQTTRATLETPSTGSDYMRQTTRAGWETPSTGSNYMRQTTRAGWETPSTGSNYMRQTTRAGWETPSTGSNYMRQTTRAGWETPSTGSNYMRQTTRAGWETPSTGSNYMRQTTRAGWGSQMSVNSWVSKASSYTNSYTNNNSDRSPMFS